MAKREKKPFFVTLQLAMVVSNVLFYLGIVMMILTVFSLISAGKMGIIQYVLAVLGVVGTAGGVMFGMVHLNCPSCGESLMPGGRLPTKLPKCCAACGSEVKGTD
ncbi:MAG: DUF1129 domain-containing protein [Ruminococcaceae bacterium]|nr:DUF1129 domain-containing protein [Oscillospiraceae bacterium]